VLCGRNAVQIAPPSAASLDLERLAENMRNIGDVKRNEYLVRFNVDEKEVTVFADGRAIVKGTDDISAARSLYARYVGS
jgi:adenylyltransferase/sulfurtransferase